MLDDLAALPGLDEVWLTDSRVTAAGVQRFRPHPNVQLTGRGISSMACREFDGHTALTGVRSHRAPIPARKAMETELRP